MKLKNKDQIITCLIDMLSQDISKTTSSEDYIHQGWIEALKWVLGITTIDNEKKSGWYGSLSESEQKDIDNNS